MTARDWLSGWDPRYARVLAEVDHLELRAALVDPNGDGRELWLGLDLATRSGGWDVALDWHDVADQQSPRRLDGPDVVLGWGRGAAGQRTVVDHGGIPSTVRVGPHGWWLLAATLSPGRPRDGAT